MIQSCTDCTEGDKHAMMALEADSASRQIKITPADNSTQNEEITAAQEELDLCQLEQKLNIPSTDPVCSDISPDTTQ